MSRTKSGMGSIVVDIGGRGGVEVRGVDVYKKPARPEPTSRIHLIPLLMVLVFFVLWVGSTEVPLSEDLKAHVSVVKTPQDLATSGQEVDIRDGDRSHHGIETALGRGRASRHKHASLFTDDPAEKTYMHGSTT